MRILITGATGFIGSHIMQTLLNEGHDMVGCVRNIPTARQRWSNIEFIHGDFTTDYDSSQWLPRLKNVDIVINTVGIIREKGNQTFSALHTAAPLALFQACELAGVKRIIQISALGADDTAFSQYHLSKRAADDGLSELEPDWIILRPSIVYGPGAKSMALFKALAGLPVIPLIDKGDQPAQPIHISDFLRIIQHFVETSKPLKRRVDIAGPTPVTMKVLHGKLRKWLGFKSPRFTTIPYPVALRLAHWGGFLGNTPMTAEAVQMLRNGNTTDSGQFIDEFGFMPKSLDQALSESPSQVSDRWYAGLYFIPAALRVSIAFVWLFTGIISAFVIPPETSYSMLAKAGIHGIWAPLMLYGAATIDILLGLATLFRYRLPLMGWVQILLILIYTLIITLSQPEQWLHPFGPITKNAPLIVSILIMIIMEKRQ